MQVIQDTNLGGRLGASLGAGINQLAQHKLAQVMQQHEKVQYAKSLAPLVGNQTANFLSNLSPKERDFALNNIDVLLKLQNNPEQEQGQSGMGALMQPNLGQNPKDVLGAIANMIGKTPEETWGEIQKNPELQRIFTEGIQLQGAPQQTSGLAAINGNQQKQEVAPQQQLQMQQISPDRASLIKDLFTPAKDRVARETLELKKSAAAQKEHAALEPFLKERFQNYNADKRIKRIAHGMLQNIEKHKDKFPGRFTGNLPEKVQDIVIRDPNVRKYMADTNSLVKLLANSDTRGQVTNAKLKLEQLAKANVGMPIETQIEILKGIVQGVDRSERSLKYMEKLKNKETGRYPIDLPSKLVEYDLAQEDPLSYPQYYSPGTEYTDDDGTVYLNRNGKEWVKKGE